MHSLKAYLHRIISARLVLTAGASFLLVPLDVATLKAPVEVAAAVAEADRVQCLGCYNDGTSTNTLYPWRVVMWWGCLEEDPYCVPNGKCSNAQTGSGTHTCTFEDIEDINVSKIRCQYMGTCTGEGEGCADLTTLTSDDDHPVIRGPNTGPDDRAARGLAEQGFDGCEEVQERIQHMAAHDPTHLRSVIAAKPKSLRYIASANVVEMLDCWGQTYFSFRAPDEFVRVMQAD